MLNAFPEGKVAFPKEMTKEGSTGNAERLSKNGQALSAQIMPGNHIQNNF